MNTAVNLSEGQLSLVRDILTNHLIGHKGLRVLAFGSRVAGLPKPLSDLDLALESDEKLEMRSIWSLKAAFQESDLNIQVDVVDLARVDPEFRKIIEAETIPFWP